MLEGVIELLASNGHLNAVELEFVFSCTMRWREERLKERGDGLVASVHRDGHCPYGETVIYDENNQFICFAPFLPYMAQTQAGEYSSIVREAHELDMLSTIRGWNTALKRIIPSKHDELGYPG